MLQQTIKNELKHSSIKAIIDRVQVGDGVIPQTDSHPQRSPMTVEEIRKDEDGTVLSLSGPRGGEYILTSPNELGNRVRVRWVDPKTGDGVVTRSAVKEFHIVATLHEDD